MPLGRRTGALLLIVASVLAAAALLGPRAASGLRLKPSPLVIAAKAEPLHASSARERRLLLANVHTWGYQLRIRDLAPLVASTTDMLVVDHGYAARHLGKTVFDPADIERLKIKPDGTRRIVLSYLSIGEAEQYRYYWQESWCKRATAPAWVGAVNPNWPGNYPVRFWNADWQKLILDPEQGYLSKIQAQGFDGIYLDRTDVYSEWGAENPHAEADMVRFLAAIAKTARAHNPGFLVVMQNAEELLAHAHVRQLLDGVAKEDLLHGLKFTEDDNSDDEIASSVTDLHRATADKIPVFAVEYLSDPVKIGQSRARLEAYGFVPTFAPRLLDSLPPELLASQPRAPAPSLGNLPIVPEPPQAPGPAWAEGGPTCLLD